jgi:HEAT repeat protein
LQALSNVAARSGDEEALRALEEGLNHHKKDTRGWAIGFMLDSYALLGRPLPPPVIARLRYLAENDIGSDVRVEAALALARLGLVDDV